MSVTAKEKREMAELGAKVSAHAVLSVLCETILYRSTPETKTQAENLVARVKEVSPYESALALALEFHESELSLHVYLLSADNNFQTKAFVPDGYQMDLYKQYNLVKNIATVYWQEFLMTHPELTGEIADFCPDLDFTNLIIDKLKPTSLYFDPLCPYRVHVACKLFNPKTKKYREFK